MNPLSAALYGYSLFSFLKNRKGDQTGNNASVSPNRLRSLLEAKVKYLTFQRDTKYSLDYSNFLQIIDTRFWYEKDYNYSYRSTCTLTVQNISKAEISLYGVIADWKIGTYYSKYPLFTLKPTIIKPGETANIVLCSYPFEYMYDESGKKIVVTYGIPAKTNTSLDGKVISEGGHEIVSLMQRVDWTDKNCRESVDTIVTLNVGLFIHTNDGKLSYRELKPYFCKIKINETKYNAQELSAYTGYGRGATARLNQIKAWKAKGYSGQLFTIPSNNTVVSDEEYDRLTGEYKNVQE